MNDFPYDDEESNVDTYDFDSIYWQTEHTDMPEIRVSPTINSNYQNSSRTPTNNFLTPGLGDARWSSSESGNPKIVSIGSRNRPPIVRGMSSGSQLTPLAVDVDPNAWELKPHELPRLIGAEAGEVCFKLLNGYALCCGGAISDTSGKQKDI